MCKPEKKTYIIHWKDGTCTYHQSTEKKGKVRTGAIQQREKEGKSGSGLKISNCSLIRSGKH